METKIMKFIVLVLIFLNLSCVTTDKSSQYYEALEEARSGNIHFAFMKLHNYLREHPGSIHAREIRFAFGEYYLQIKNYYEAINNLISYLKDYQEDESTIFAKAMLYKALFEYKKEPSLVEEIKEDFFSKSLFLTFSESKIKNYKSILNNSYKILNYIDKIQVFKNNDLFLSIAP